MRSLRGVALLCLVGAALVLVGCSSGWVTAPVDGLARSGFVHDRATGADLAPELRAVGVVGAVSVIALLALRFFGRRLVGTLLAALALLSLVIASPNLSGERLRENGLRVMAGCDEQGGCLVSDGQAELVVLHRAGPVTALGGGLLLVLAGSLAAWRGHRWGGLGSSYQAPGAAPEPPVTDKGVWDALDRGDDPTA